MKKFFLLTLSLFFVGVVFSQIDSGKYLSDIKNQVIEGISQINELSEGEKNICINNIYEVLKRDHRIKNQLPDFQVEFELKKVNKSKQINYVYNFGTQVSLTSKYFIFPPKKS